MREIPVLLYHNVGHYPEEMMEDGLLPETFEAQMAYFAKNGYIIVPLEDAVSHLNGQKKLPQKSIALTFDGGYKDAYTNVFPILKKHNYTATFFVIPETIEKERFLKGKAIPCMTWDEVAELLDAGMEIGLLANGGASIRYNYDENVLKESIVNSLNIIKNNFPTQIRFCAFKEGVPGPSLWDFIQSLGFKAVFTQCPTNQPATPAGIGRIQIDDDDHNIFLTKISPTYLFFKDRPSWKYIRKYHLDKMVHHLSETWNRMKGNL